MKLKTLLLTLLLSTSLIGTTYADHLDGLDAYKKGGDYNTAFKEIQPLADQGDAIAQYNLGVMYDYGKGVLKDYQQAAKWYRKAADQGNALAQFSLGRMYAYGEGVLKDLTKAKYWTKKAYENPDEPEKGRARITWDKFELWKY